MTTMKTISENQKRAMKTAIDYYTNPMFRNWYAVAHTNKYKEGNKIVFSNQTETGAMYFKVMNHRKMLYIGMIYSDRIVNNYECIDYFTNPKVIKHAAVSFRKLGEMQENKIEYPAEVTEVRDRLKALPSAQLERKKGEWIPVTNGRGGFECDQCHNYAPSYQDGVEWLSGFCPNCGAKMEDNDNE